MLRKSIIVLSAAFALCTPALALTIGEVYGQLGGMYCSENTCTSEEDTSRVNQLPDITTTVTTLVSPETFVDPAQPTHDGTRGFWNERCQTFAYVNKDCTVQSIAPLGGGTPAVYKTVTTVTPGGTEVVATCTTTTKTVVDPGHSSSGEWEIDTSVSSSDGGC